MPLYWVIIILGTLLIFAFWKRSSRLSWRTVLTSLSFAVLFGLLLAKLVYILTQAMRDLLDYGLEILFEADPSTFSFFGGAGLSAEANPGGTYNVCDWNSTENKYKGVDVAQAMLEQGII